MGFLSKASYSFLHGLRNTSSPARFTGTLDIRAKPRWDIYTGDPKNGSKRISAACPNKATWNPFKRAGKVQLYSLLRDFGFYSEFGLIVVKAGFSTDFGSVPALAKWLVDDDDPDLLFASIIHDDLYNRKGVVPGLSKPKLTRKEADGVLRDAMLACGAPNHKANLVYWAVRTGGRGTWNEP